MPIQEAKKNVLAGVQTYCRLSEPMQNFKRDGCGLKKKAAMLIPVRCQGQICASWASWYTYEDEPRERATGRTNSILFIVHLYLNIVENIIAAACTRTGVRKISTDAPLAEGVLEGAKNWCTTERGVHYTREEGTCGALRRVEAMA